MFIFNQVKLEGLDGLYGENFPNWSTEVSELINPSMAPSLQEMQQLCSPVDEQVHLNGMQWKERDVCTLTVVNLCLLGLWYSFDLY